MPNQIGAFLKASKCFSALGINITRVSYNKAVDSHTLFIDAEGTEEQLNKADTELGKIGYLQSNVNKTSIVLIEFYLRINQRLFYHIHCLINCFLILMLSFKIISPYHFLYMLNSMIQQIYKILLYHMYPFYRHLHFQVPE